MNFKKLLIVNNHSDKYKIDNYNKFLIEKKTYIDCSTKKPSISTKYKFRILIDNSF